MHTENRTGQTEVSSNAMVSSADVNGTAVYSPDGDHIGSIDHLIIDKMSGNVAYAVMQFGGFLGLGGEEHPLPWKTLHYDTALEGFVTNVTREQLEGQPERPADWVRDRRAEEQLHSYYGVGPYWF